MKMLQKHPREHDAKICVRRHEWSSDPPPNGVVTQRFPNRHAYQQVKEDAPTLNWIGLHERPPKSYIFPATRTRRLGSFFNGSWKTQVGRFRVSWLLLDQQKIIRVQSKSGIIDSKTLAPSIDGSVFEKGGRENRRGGGRQRIDRKKGEKTVAPSSILYQWVQAAVDDWEMVAAMGKREIRK